MSAERSSGAPMNKFVVLRIFFWGLFMLTLAASSRSQQTIFNVPSADVLDKGKVYFELDASFKPNSQDAVHKFSTFVPRLVVGIGNNVEVGLNVTGNIQPGADSTTLVPAVKWRPYHNEKNGWSIVTGANMYIPFRNRSYDAGVYLYAQASKSFKSGTRVTGGGFYCSPNVVALHAHRGGGQFGFEQTVNKYLNINADWITGKHGSGYFTPGISFRPAPKLTGYMGYSIGNGEVKHGNHFFLLELGYSFD
jgi:hypothetical protein